MTKTLLGLFQQDAEAAAPALTIPAPSQVDWIDGFKWYLGDIGQRYSRLTDVPSPARKVAAACLQLAAQSLQVGTAVPEGFERPVAASGGATTRNSRAVVFAVVLLAVGLLNVWLMDAAGMISTLALLPLFGHFYWDEIAAALRRKGKARKRDVAAAPVMELRPAIEGVVRRTDDIVALAGQQHEAPEPRGLKESTLEFFQDILEAKISDDRDYAFKKISRTVGSVLAGEGIEVSTDAVKQAAMFRFDTVVDGRRAEAFEVVRPALIVDAKCVLPGYAKRFVAA